MAAEAIARVLIQKINLLLQFLRGSPVVVTFTNGDVFTLGGGYHIREQDAAFALLILVFFLQDWPKERGILGIIISDDFCCAVSGGIVVDDDLHWEIGFLLEEAFNALFDKSLMIVGNATDAHQGTGSLRPLVFGDWARGRQALEVSAFT
jgi:hypothetical protein